MNKSQIPRSGSLIPQIDLGQYAIDPEILELIDVNLAKKYVLIPIKRESDTLFVAMADPLNIFAIDDLKITTGLNINPLIAEKQSILDAIERYYGTETARKAVEDFYRQYEVKQSFKMADEAGIDEVNHAPVVRLLDSIFRQAIQAKASDIHIEPFKNYVRIRFRIDGELQEILSLHIATHSAILTRVKIMGRLNIAEKRIPQDGRIEINIDGKTIDL
ncbi:MAG TPA: Flp pilus assembly complex ATPase component TadA, partial [Clostridiales bacterium]|nr:Flp pilus assembly complex ATPase component TadA [Clostridiales bacterium]